VQLITPLMRQQGSEKILNVSSIGGKGWEPLGDWYHATKFAVEGFSDCLRVELKPFGIDVIVIEPGAIRTEWGQIALDTPHLASGHTAYAPQAEEKRAMFLAASGSASNPDIVAPRNHQSHPELASEDRLRSGFFRQTIGIDVDFYARPL
jgi:NAD(P)-dependent dehydrogenase (short-subunit alcohol dehydrogenase family)